MMVTWTLYCCFTAVKSFCTRYQKCLNMVYKMNKSHAHSRVCFKGWVFWGQHTIESVYVLSRTRKVEKFVDVST